MGNGQPMLTDLGDERGHLACAIAIARIITKVTWWLALIEPGNDMSGSLAWVYLTGDVHEEFPLPQYLQEYKDRWHLPA
jgi:hypothetical protein